MKIEITQLKAEEIQKLSEVYVAAYNANETGECWSAVRAYELLQQFYQQNEKICLAARVDDETVGALLTHINHWWSGNQLYIDELFVAPEFQKSGIGTELMQTAALIAQKDFAALEISLCTFRNKKHPLSWYQKLGFRENETLTLLEADIATIIS